MARQAKRLATGSTPALVALAKAGIDFTSHSYHHDPRSGLSYGLEAALALGIEPYRVFKTLLASVDERLVVAVVPVSGQLDLKALAEACGGKRAVMADAASAERSSGYVVGGMSPLGQRQPLPTVVDSSSSQLETMFVSAGRRGLDVELTPSALVTLTGARLAAIGRA